jgi:hypothetical protein
MSIPSGKPGNSIDPWDYESRKARGTAAERYPTEDEPNPVPAQISIRVGKAGDFCGPAVRSRHDVDSLCPYFDLRLPFSQPRLAGI